MSVGCNYFLNLADRHLLFIVFCVFIHHRQIKKRWKTMNIRITAFICGVVGEFFLSVEKHHHLHNAIVRAEKILHMHNPDHAMRYINFIMDTDADDVEQMVHLAQYVGVLSSHDRMVRAFKVLYGIKERFGRGVFYYASVSHIWHYQKHSRHSVV